ncbi:MAG: tetratricopeptide repeat protein [Chloroflexi bacterium]|nr:tetratricopeptide repeat protein [Chloroflexota bacterium]
MKRKLVFPTVLILTALCLALGIYAVFSASQPVVSCGAAAKTSTLKAPPALISAQDYLAQGDYDYEQGACYQAIADYTRAIELDPRLAEGYNSRAYIYMVQKAYATALPDLDRAIQLRPGYVNALMNRGDIYNYYYAINYERAVADYDQVLKADPNAASHTSVCGHRLLAFNHGWNLKVLGYLLTSGVKAGCPNSKP